MHKFITSFLFITVLGLSACSDDEPKDSAKEIRMQVSAETGVMYAWGDNKKENPIECMLVMSDDNPGVWEPLEFNGIEWFTYERGHEYYLLVKRTILANPPADASDRTYSLIRILEDRAVTEPEVPVDEEITSEEDIEYYDLCPFEKYAVSKGYIVDENGKIFYDDGSLLPSYDMARIWHIRLSCLRLLMTFVWYATIHMARCSKASFPKKSLPVLHKPCSPVKKSAMHSFLQTSIRRGFKS